MNTKMQTTIILIIIISGSQVICPRFEESTYPQVLLTKLTNEADPDFNYSPQLRMKLCYYAKLKARLHYIDSDYVPEWKEIYLPIKVPQPIGFGMYCATLPTIYLLRQHKNFETIQITYLDSLVRHYIFANSIIRANSIKLRNDLESEFSETNLVSLNPEDRRNLCAAAQEHAQMKFHFLDYNVSPAEPYEFRIAGKTETDIALSCPTSPHLYLRRGNSETEVKLILYPSFLDEFEYEVDIMKPTSIIPVQNEKEDVFKMPSKLSDSLTRLNSQGRRSLCSIARTHWDFHRIVPFVHDKTVPEAQLYSFKYDHDEEEKLRTAIVCPAVPSMFLYLDETSMLENLIKITFLKTIADEQSYTVVIYGIESTIISFYKLDENFVAASKEDRKILKRHLFNTLDRENRWSLCLGAQKYLVGDVTLTFNRTEREAINRSYKLLMIPQFMEKPKLYSLKSRDSGSSQKVVMIQCSIMPEVYIGLGKSPNTIEILLKDHEVEPLDR